MKEKLANLIDVKSIVTISLTILFMILAIRGAIEPEKVVTIYTTIIAFYFGTQYQKAKEYKANIENNPEITNNTEKSVK